MTLEQEVAKRRPIPIEDRPDPVAWAEDIAGIRLDPWQRNLLSTTHKRQLLLCSRQTGKTEAVALKAAYETAFNPGASVLVIAPTLRQSRNLFDRLEFCLLNDASVGRPTVHTRTMIRLPHGGTVRALPGDKPDMVRGLTATSVILDEAAFCRESIMAILLPMLATTNGSMAMLSTPSGPTGVFYDAWQSDDWHKTMVLAHDCPRITIDFLEDAKRQLGDLAFRQEYLCEFIQTSTAFFSADMIDAAFSNDRSTFVDQAPPRKSFIE
jgi:hypothetical protein